MFTIYLRSNNYFDMPFSGNFLGGKPSVILLPGCEIVAAEFQ
jgi:hypothetical protein